MKIAKDIDWKFWDLKHDHGKGHWDGYSPLKTYVIYDVSEKYPGDNRFYVPGLSNQFELLEEAQDACQEHFNTTVRLCLSEDVTFVLRQSEEVATALRVLRDSIVEAFPAMANIGPVKRATEALEKGAA